MFFYLSKILVFMLVPAMWILILAVTGFFIKKARIKKACYFTAFFIFLLFSNPCVFNQTIKTWEEPPRRASLPASGFDYGIVPGGMIYYDYEYKQVQFNDAVGRLLYAVKLYKEGRLRKILICGGSGSVADQEYKEALFIKEYLLSMQIPDSNIVIESESRNSYENAQYTARILKNEKNARCLLITSSLHMKRAKACFDKAGITTESYPINRISRPQNFYPDRLIIPDLNVLISWNALIHEITGYCIYNFLGYI